MQSVRYLPSSNTEKGYSTTVVATTTTTVSVEELSPPKGRRAKGTHATSHHTHHTHTRASPTHSMSRHYWLRSLDAQAEKQSCIRTTKRRSRACRRKHSAGRTSKRTRRSVPRARTPRRRSSDGEGERVFRCPGVRELFLLQAVLGEELPYALFMLRAVLVLHPRHFVYCRHAHARPHTDTHTSERTQRSRGVAAKPLPNSTGWPATRNTSSASREYGSILSSDPVMRSTGVRVWSLLADGLCPFTYLHASWRRDPK